MAEPTPTIAALLTPLAPGAIAVVGLTGPDTDEILAPILRRPGDDRPPQLLDHRPTLCRLTDGHDVVDDVVVVRIPRGGAVFVELNTHGGVRIAQRALMLLERRGAKIVDPDDFPASPTGTDVMAIEGDADRVLQRVTARRLTRWLLSQRTVLPAYLRRYGRLTRDEVTAFRRRSQAAIRLVRGLRLALVGPPNAGKSTLANRLIGTDRMVTSDRPGTTRDWVDETALIRGWPVTLIDTAGLQETACRTGSEAIRRGQSQAGSADLVLAVLDATVALKKQRSQLEAAEHLLEGSRLGIIVQNKCDLPEARSGSPPGCRPALPCLRISALTGDGVEQLETRIESALGLDLLDESLPTAFLPDQLLG